MGLVRVPASVSLELCTRIMGANANSLYSDLAQSIYSRVVPALIMHFDWEFENPSAEHETVTMFMPRLHNVNMKWTQRILK
jgi:hypothetical protein